MAADVSADAAVQPPALVFPLEAPVAPVLVPFEVVLEGKALVGTPIAIGFEAADEDDEDVDDMDDVALIACIACIAGVVGTP